MQNNKRLPIYIAIAEIIIGLSLISKSMFGALLIVISGVLCFFMNIKSIKYFVIGFFAIGLLIALIQKPGYQSKFKHCGDNNVCEIVIIDKEYVQLFNGKKYKYEVHRKNGKFRLDVSSTYMFSYDNKTGKLCYLSNDECLYEFSKYKE